MKPHNAIRLADDDADLVPKLAGTSEDKRTKRSQWNVYIFRNLSADVQMVDDKLSVEGQWKANLENR
jgi:hypothetical protein